MKLASIPLTMALCGLATACSSPREFTRTSYVPAGSTTAYVPAGESVADGRTLAPKRLSHRQVAARAAAGVNPSDVLVASERSRVTWAPLVPNRELHRTNAPPPPMVSGIPDAATPTTGSTARAESPARPVSARGASRDEPTRHARDKALDGPGTGGRGTGNPVCTGC